MSEGGEALLFLFCAVVGLLILLMIGAVIYLHLKIKKIGRLLVELKNKDE